MVVISIICVGWFIEIVDGQANIDSINIKKVPVYNIALLTTLPILLLHMRARIQSCTGNFILLNDLKQKTVSKIMNMFWNRNLNGGFSYISP